MGDTYLPLVAKGQFEPSESEDMWSFNIIHHSMGQEMKKGLMRVS